MTEGLGAVGMAMTMEVRAKAAAANEMATILAIGWISTAVDGDR